MKITNAKEMEQEFQNQIKYAKNFGVWLIKNEVCFNVRNEDTDWYEFGGKGLGCLATMDILIQMFNDEFYKDSIHK